MSALLTGGMRRVLAAMVEGGDPQRASWRQYLRNSRGRLLTDDECTRNDNRTLLALQRRDLVRDGRHIAEDGQTITGSRWELTNEGRAILAESGEAK